MADRRKSPKKSLSVRQDVEGKKTIHVKTNDGFYKSIANFYFEIVCFVEFPTKWNRYNGYLLEVFRKDGIEMKSHVTVEEMGSAKHFRSAINRTFSSKGGIMWQCVSDVQLNQYLINATDNFWQANGVTKRATLTIGKQSSYVDNEGVHTSFIMNENIQLDKYGNIIPQDEQDYIWMIPYLKSMPTAQNDKAIKEYLKSTPVKITEPLQEFSWARFFERARIFFGNNFFPFMMFFSGAITAFHYEDVLNIIGSCPSPMAVGDTACGKSTALRLIQQLLGCNFVSQSSAEAVASELVRTTIPLCWDDPTHAVTLKKVLVSTFQRGGTQTKSSGSEIPETTFLLTVNFTLDNDMRCFERTTPIWFNKIVFAAESNSCNFLEERKEMFSMASTYCIPSIIRMSRELTHHNLIEHVHFFGELLKGLPSRLSNIYASYRLFAFKIIEEIDDVVVVTKSEFDDYLKEDFIPYVNGLYGSSESLTKVVYKNVDDFFLQLGKAVEKTAGLAGNEIEARNWIKPKVMARKSVYGDTVHLNLSNVEKVFRKAGMEVSLIEFKSLVSQIPGASTAFRSVFPSQEGQIACIKIPRMALGQNCLLAIDSWLELTDTIKEDAMKMTCTNCIKKDEYIRKLEKVIFENVPHYDCFISASAGGGSSQSKPITVSASSSPSEASLSASACACISTNVVSSCGSASSSPSEASLTASACISTNVVSSCGSAGSSRSKPITVSASSSPSEASLTASACISTKVVSSCGSASSSRSKPTTVSASSTPSEASLTASACISTNVVSSCGSAGSSRSKPTTVSASSSPSEASLTASACISTNVVSSCGSAGSARSKPTTVSASSTQSKASSFLSADASVPSSITRKPVAIEALRNIVEVSEQECSVEMGKTTAKQIRRKRKSAAEILSDSLSKSFKPSSATRR